MQFQNEEDSLCPHCKKELFVKPDEATGIKGLVIKNIKLVLLANSGQVFVKCKGCKNPVHVPFLNFDKK